MVAFMMLPYQTRIAIAIYGINNYLNWWVLAIIDAGSAYVTPLSEFEQAITPEQELMAGGHWRFGLLLLIRQPFTPRL
jgi:hypothetical protein